ncbi:2-keto-4-pentenoate hydratase [Granulicoccus phenolivorans]|uniref:2-keto-4-pentenoate hydratase n=1 Tax=Granulicoccus phenolivorans TaxID=266854 RepID=UPI00041D6936|nr:fumarylacetoacetate hydrolase family protein [Granulicoccus phenolivorans]
MSNDQHQKFADLLLNSYVTKTPIPPLRDQIEGMTLDDAYEIQLLQEKAYVAKGDPVVGRKIGLTSLAMQQQLGVDQPDFGFVTASMVSRGDHTFAPDAFIQPKVEPELAIVLGKDLKGPGVTLEQAIEATAGAYAAIEIIDSRIEDWKISLVDTVSDNASSGGIAYALEPIDVPIPDLDKVECSLRLDGEVVASGVGTDVMGHPIQPMVWLANLLGERGITLEAGQVVMTGSFTSAFVVEHGHNATADFGELGSITLTF